MVDRLFSLPGTESGEESKLSMLLTQSFFLGIYFGILDITAHSLFLSVFDEKMMAKGYVVSGTIGIFFVSLFTMLRSRVKFRYLAKVNLVFITLITFVIWILLIFYPLKLSVFFLFILFGPLNIMAIMGLKGTTDHLSGGSGKNRLYRVSDGGMIAGIIISSFMVAILVSLGIEMKSLILIGASAVSLATIIQIPIGSQFQPRDSQERQQHEKVVTKVPSLKILHEEPSARIIYMFICLAVISLFFIQYSFMAVTRMQYPSASGMARFLGIFTGSMMILTLLFRRIGFSLLLKNYGIRAALVIPVLFIAILTAAVILTGSLTGYNTVSAGGFIIFFILIALTRLFSRSLKDSFVPLSLNVIIQLINEKIRDRTEKGTEDIINEIAVLIAGLLLAGLGIMSFIKLIHFSFVLFVILLSWIYIALRLYETYKGSIHSLIEKAGKERPLQSKLPERIYFKGRFFAERSFRKDYFSLITGDFSCLGDNNNSWYYKRIIDYSVNNNDINLIPVLKKLANDKNLDSEIRRKSDELSKELYKNYITPGGKAGGNLLPANRLLYGHRSPQATDILRLLRDKSVDSKRAALYLIGKFQLSDMLPEVCECLNLAELEADAGRVIRSFGIMAVNELERYYMVSSGNINISRAILRIFAKIPGKESSAFLLSRLWSTSRQLKEIAIKGLLDGGYKPSSEEKENLCNLISDIIGVITWDLSLKVCLQKNHNTLIMREITCEINRWVAFLFNTLSVIYGSGIISEIRKYIEEGTEKNLTVALEMTDIIIDNSLKERLKDLIKIAPDEIKVRNLCKYYPGIKHRYPGIAEDILNRDYNLISVWTKACTLRNLPGVEGDELYESVVALLFSPQEILREESARLLARSNNELYRSASQRISEITRIRLDNIIYGDFDERDLIFEKTLFLSGYFSGIPGEELQALAASLRLIKEYKNGIPLLNHDCIIWIRKEGADWERPYIHYAEQQIDPFDNFRQKRSDSVYLLPLYSVDKHLSQFEESAFGIIKYIDKIEE